MPGFIIVVIFSINGLFAHSFTVDKVFDTEAQCHQVADAASKDLLESGKTPPGASVTAGCITLPPSISAKKPNSESGTL